MPTNKRAVPTGRKQTAMPAPKSAAYKKIVAAKLKKTAAAGKPAPKSAGKRPKHVAAYSTVESRQRALERMKRTIWLHLDEINGGIIRLAVAGNYLAARALFDIAGVYSLPPIEEAKALPAAPPVDTTPDDDASSNSVDAFFKSIGVEPLCGDPEPRAA